MYRRIVSTTVGLLLTIVIGCPATAEQFTQVVKYHDLDLTTPRGVKAFGRRLSRAVTHVCGLASAGDDMLQSANRHCRDDTAKAVRPRMQQAIALAERRAATRFASR